MKSKIGYIYKNDPYQRRWIQVYKSIQELRLCCGEIPAKEIEKVEIVWSQNEKDN